MIPMAARMMMVQFVTVSHSYRGDMRIRYQFATLAKRIEQTGHEDRCDDSFQRAHS